ncbi:hypothetical protein QWI17_16945 [Gilvimarinus sp. SDUM040013]|uniref:Uncharacterized protein n=1 Tax=Gilvimarinus gilvus TaxID=3058038 RepID=A0ABU4S4T1_9GAMM|nr:hypothetical protein [Gilvimarinus sp. SDUM040013]MDO3387532.1 hypothetical protein [Gilvimarinus sp. SDUM040013]MDX6851522.1 hypothetical protein [Gilvimarinus sp. SDUM040013]
MSEEPLKTLSDQVGEAHAKIQRAHQHINPVVAVRSGMRDAGIPADVMTIDCLRTRRRIMLVLHDEQPGILLHQFGSVDSEASDEFQRKNLSDVGVDVLFEWMQDYFSDAPEHS